MSKHTSGPWTYINHGWQNTSVVTRDTDQLVCTLSLYEEDVTEDNQEELEAEQEANARLITAAPDLLEACRKASTCSSIPDYVMDLIRAAIAKATQ